MNYYFFQIPFNTNILLLYLFDDYIYEELLQILKTIQPSQAIYVSCKQCMYVNNNRKMNYCAAYNLPRKEF